MAHEPDQPVLLSKWYDVVKWLLERVDSFPKNQGSASSFGADLARALAAYLNPRKVPLLVFS